MQAIADKPKRLLANPSNRVFFIFAFWLGSGHLAWASIPVDAATKAQIVGHPAAVVVQPKAITLSGPRAMQQIIVTGIYPDGQLRDLTVFCDISADSPGIVSIQSEGMITPEKEGETALRVQAAGQSVRIPVRVTELANPRPASFRHELIAALNVGGCNAGACHGTPSGKNGFRLSLRGYDPAADYLQLTRDVMARRTDRLNPDASMILQKPLGKIPHEGGLRFQEKSLPAQVIRTWIAEGLQDDPADLPALQTIEVLPGSRVLQDPARWEQLAVLARFADGAVRDVTRLTVFTSSDTAVASVSNTGLVEFQQSGEIAVLCRFLDVMHAVRLTFLEPKKDFHWTSVAENNYIDRHVSAKLKMMSIQPSELCTDQEFIRRAFLDVCGILPTAEETKTFLASGEKDKRARLIDRLLERPEYADFWTLKWCDVLRSDRKTIQVKGTFVYQNWLRDRIAGNTPFNQIVRDLLTSSGSTFANPPANFYRIAADPQNLAETTAQLFFGIRMQCAKCHNHPFEKWTQDDYYGMAAFFARVKGKKDPSDPGAAPPNAGAELIYLDRTGEVMQPRSGKVMPPKFMGGPVAPVHSGQDRRQVLADWLTSPKNPFFAKSVVNRVWFHLLGRGIVDPVDDFRDSNPSANDELLDALAHDFVASQFDLKHLIRVILNSRTYQLSAQANATNKDDNKYFSHAVTRLLTAEQLLDAICTVTEMPEKFANVPLGTRAVQLPDGEMNHPFLKTFGQPGRELACECEREQDSNLAQALQLINGPTVNEKLRNANNHIGKLLGKKNSESAMLNDLYMAALSRLPNEAESKLSLAHVAKGADKRKAWEDVQWALINSKEFLFRH
ncbi:MAG TPA: DUF1549 and DUF1553 domain-containing protein [Gemmataceae bacterium]|nr:DUF1549 and DUF1553 domain-containing protein [Gemmataceae bacterium]